MKVTQFTFENEKKVSPWKSSEKKQLLSTAIFNVNTIDRENSKGQKGTFIELESKDWINIIPVFTGTDGQEYFIMERQFRHGSASITTEFPAGLIEKGEDPEAAAKRELLEETGIKAGKLTKLADICPNSAFMANRAHFYLAEDLDYTGTRNFDENEDIQTVCLPVKKVLAQMGKDSMDNGIMLISCFLFTRYRGFEV